MIGTSASPLHLECIVVYHSTKIVRCSTLALILCSKQLLLGCASPGPDTAQAERAGSAPVGSRARPKGSGGGGASPRGSAAAAGDAIGDAVGGAGGGGGLPGARAGGAGRGGVAMGGGSGGGRDGADGGPGRGDGGGATDPGPKIGQEMASCGQVNAAAGAVRIEAECALGTSCQEVVGGQSGTVLEGSGTTVGYIEPKDWLSFGGVRLDGYTSLKVSYAKGTAGGSLEVRLDSPTGTLLGSRELPTTDSWSSWAQTSLALSPSTGAHTLYLVAAGTGTAGVCNLDWLELSGGATNPSADAAAIHVNQVAYEALGPKHAIVEGKTGLERFQVVHVGGASAWCGELVPIAFSEWGGSTYYSVDFSGLTALGKYQVAAGGKLSSEFEIAEGALFQKTFPSVLSYFQKSRADDADVWAADAKIPLAGGGGPVDVRGGWYDASGDISKYLSHLSYANYLNPQQIPLVAWGLAWVRDSWVSTWDATKLKPDVEKEALWGADYLLRVLDPAGYFYITVFDGWSGEMSARQVCAFRGANGEIDSNYQAAFREGGGMAIAALARIGRWGLGGSFAATEYVAAAEKAFAYLQVNNTKHDDDGKENIIDDYAALLAASELFATTQKADYLTAARARASNLAKRLHATGYFLADDGSRPFWHASDAGLPVVALARYTEIETDATARSAALKTIAAHLDYLVRVTGEVANPFGYARQHVNTGGSAKSSFFIPHDNESAYWWQGENARLASLAAAALIGGSKLAKASDRMLEVKSEYVRFAGSQLDWILGANPFDLCFLQGAGKKNPDPYCQLKAQNGSLSGGICNGITGRGTDGSGIQWLASDGACWESWRWSEQWLPHSAWYMIAVSAMAGGASASQSLSTR